LRRCFGSIEAKLRLPFYGSYQQVDPVVIVAKGFSQLLPPKQYKIVLVDTLGRYSQEAALLQELTEVIAAEQSNTTLRGFGQGPSWSPNKTNKCGGVFSSVVATQECCGLDG
jgi:SRP54-type protein, GTPase domain